MPRVNFGTTVGTSGTSQVRLHRILLGYEVDAAKLASCLGCCATTARSRINDPGLLTIAELKKAAKFFRIPAEEIRSAIQI